MRSPFGSKIKITQKFGVNAEYYAKFGLKGHEGLDCVPTGTNWEVRSLADGVVVNESDDPRSGAYGIWLTVWHPTIKKATQYCHLKENYIEPGDKVTAGQKIGTMGTTGNSTGPHLHLNVFDVDSNGVRLNKNNGYNGGIDPEPFLDSLATDATLEESATTVTVLASEWDGMRKDRDNHYNDKMAMFKELGYDTKFDLTVSVERIKGLLVVEKSAGEKESQNKELTQKVSDLTNKLAYAISEHTVAVDSFQTSINEMQQKLDELKSLKEKYIELELEAVELRKDVNAGKSGWDMFKRGIEKMIDEYKIIRR